MLLDHGLTRFTKLTIIYHLLEFFLAVGQIKKDGRMTTSLIKHTKRL